jgi:hypothetical protein
MDKKCARCKVSKPIDEFGVYKSLDGHRSWCKSCHSYYNKRYNVGRGNYHRNYYKENRTKIQTSMKRRRIRIRIEVLTYYGNGKCACVICNEQRLPCLSIDHVLNNGYAHRKELGVSKVTHFCEWLKQSRFPVGYQTLCMNCQWIKRAEAH